MANPAQWVLAGILIAFFILVATVNAIYLVGQVRTRFEYGPSLLPFIGGLAGLGGVMLLPVGNWTDRLAWSWLPPLLDAGTLPYIAIGLFFSVRDRKG